MLSKTRLTKGKLLGLKQRQEFIEKGCEFLKLKQENLARELIDTIKVLQGKRTLLLKKLKEAYQVLTATYLVLGPSEVKSYFISTKEDLKIEILPKSVMGVRYPFVKILSKPQMENDLDIALTKLSGIVYDVLEDIIELSEQETKVERVADELSKTKRKVNILEDSILPEYKRLIKIIEEKIDEESLEELVRMKRGVSIRHKT